MAKRYFLFSLVWVLFAKPAFASHDTAVFNPLLRQMKHFSDTLRNSFNQQKRYAANDSFKYYLKEFVETEGSFDVEADSISSVMFKRSPDRKIRTITWLLADNAGNYQSFGVVQHKRKKKEEPENIWLKEKTHVSKKELENTELSENDWTGGLIYHIQEITYKRKTRYLILTFHGLGTQTNQKTIDVMTFEKDGITFGLPVFMRYENDPDPDYRVVFTYSDQATMTLRYDTKEKLIVFDHLVPAADFVRGSEEFLIPDGTYGGYVPKRKGRWQRIEDFGEYKRWDEQ